MLGALIGAAGSVLGGLFGKRSADKAVSAQDRAAQMAVEEQRRQFDLSREDQMPWLTSGRNALADLDALSGGDMSRFYASPDYGFRRDEGIRGIERTAAARGGALSGNALRALADFNSNLAAGEYGNYWNRTAQRAGVGQTAANTLAGLGANTAGNIGNALMAGGDARASGIAAGANALTQGLSGAIDAWNYFRPQRPRNTLPRSGAPNPNTRGYA